MECAGNLHLEVLAENVDFRVNLNVEGYHGNFHFKSVCTVAD